MSSYLGEIAGLLTSVMFSASSSIFSLASRKVGSAALNRLRLILAVGWLLLAHLLTGTPLPLDAEPQRWLWLTISGILGLVIGDMFLFQAYVWIGARLTMLMMALAPAISAVAAWLLTGETLSRLELLGMILTLAGIAWVIVDQPQPDMPSPTSDGSADRLAHDTARRNYILGLLCGLGAAAGQALGLVTARLGLGGNFPALSGTLMRMLTAAIILWTLTLLAGQAGKTVHLFAAHPAAVWQALGGSFFGPFAGVTLSLYAVQHTAVGVASTLTSLSPIILLPVAYFAFKERFGWQSVAGTLLAMVGVAMLFM